MSHDTVDRTLKGPDLLAAAAAEVASWPSISPSRARQVKWVAGEYTRALAHVEHPLGAGARYTELFTAEPVRAYLKLARTGQLRVRQAADPAKASDNSEQIRLEVLRLLVTACDAFDYAELPPQGEPPRKKPVAKRPRSLLRAQLTQLADAPDATTSQLRMLAIGAVVCDTGIRAGEMCALRIEDLSPDLQELRVVRRPQGWHESEAFTELIPLSTLSRAALRRWLPERHRLLERVGGTATALWVSLHGNHQDGRTAPAGTPLMPRGLARAWTRAVTETNIEMAGQPSWTPLPARMEQLRRGVKPTAAPAPMEPDAEKAVLLLDEAADRGRALAGLRRAEGGDEDTAGLVLKARQAVRLAVRDAWAEGIEHSVQLSVLADAGLTDEASLAAAGWEPALLAAIDRGQGWGRPSKAAAAG
ncbi:tyrosine-type recombinase/integrase [Streptomyces antarcticus]|uniref:tyrosine-type recombinase/integrase n=1 Tax=Streptomyces antarcticus TaxID=2996458 RepID=UPI00226D4686|nr:MULTISPECIES: tyrosine-type recombinase/integrase [unclassified Streptomyces]MCY0947287.1 tyrosine-type recombinase/integrase [Streptomyces sp. H34-AA3]MCZ4086532.1 tyrosine-type recombinase/integrase [Streptomyces sp. H34-S5]